MSSPPSSPDFASWSASIREGNPAVEDEAARWFQPRLRAFFLARTRNRDTADELVQEALITVLCTVRAGQVRQADRLDAFVYGIARNLLLNRYRRDSQEQFEPLPDDLSSPLDPAPEDADRRREARRAIDELPPADRQILLMTLVDDMKPGEIAAQVGLTSEVVRQRKTRALKKLLDKLRPASRNSTGTPLTGERGR